MAAPSISTLRARYPELLIEIPDRLRFRRAAIARYNEERRLLRNNPGRRGGPRIIPQQVFFCLFKIRLGSFIDINFSFNLKLLSPDFVIRKYKNQSKKVWF